MFHSAELLACGDFRDYIAVCVVLRSLPKASSPEDRAVADYSVWVARHLPDGFSRCLAGRRRYIGGRIFVFQTVSFGASRHSPVRRCVQLAGWLDAEITGKHDFDLRN